MEIVDIEPNRARKLANSIGWIAVDIAVKTGAVELVAGIVDKPVPIGTAVLAGTVIKFLI